MNNRINRIEYTIFKDKYSHEVSMSPSDEY